MKKRLLMKKRLFSFLATHRRNSLVRNLDSVLIRLHKAYENRNYNFYRNGESEVLKKLKTIQNVNTIFDVGANKGIWSAMASDFFPHTTIYSFEIVPETYKRLVKKCGQQKNIVPYNIGLSDVQGTITVYYPEGKSPLATCVAGFSERFYKFQPQKVEARVSTGDIFCSENGIETIDFLKIDVEGYEHKVLQGFEGMLKKEQIKIIQFEYGFINIDTHFLLKDFYDYLSGFGMRIGKIYPSYVDFREYRYFDENFYGPNYLAVHSSCGRIMDALHEF